MSEEKINEAIDNLTEAARVNGLENDPVVSFLLNHLAEFADDLGMKYEEDETLEKEEEE